jgi:hypothetical protein
MMNDSKPPVSGACMRLETNPALPSLSVSAASYTSLFQLQLVQETFYRFRLEGVLIVLIGPPESTDRARSAEF